MIQSRKRTRPHPTDRVNRHQTGYYPTDVDAVRDSLDLRDADGSVLMLNGVSITCPSRGLALDYMEQLRRLAINDPRFGEVGGAEFDSRALDSKTLELVRLAALVAVGGAVPSYGAQADAAVGAGATLAEIVDVLVGVVPIVGLPCAVAEAPKLALALGYDINDALEHQSG